MATVAAAVGEGAAENAMLGGSGNHVVQDSQDTSKMHESKGNGIDDSVLAINSDGNEKVDEGSEKEEGGNSSTAEPAEEVLHLGKFRFALVSIAICFGMFIPSLDESIIATVIPKLTSEFKSLGDIGWYGSAYLMSGSAFQFLFGQCYTFFQTKWVFMAAVAIFEVGSIVCATAPSSTAFIIGCTIAGLGTTGAISGAVNIVAHTVSLRHRAVYLGTLGAITGLASLAGPVLGGTFADSHLTWRWCFWINLPIGGFTLLILATCVPNPAPETTEKISWRQKVYKLDLGGTAIFLPAIICLLLALQFGGGEYAWSNARVIILLVLAAVFLACFFLFERWMGESVSIPIRVVTKKNVVFGALFVFFLDGGFYIMDYYISLYLFPLLIPSDNSTLQLPIWFQAIKGKTAEQSGISSLPFVISTVITYMLVGYAVSAVAYYHPFMIVSSILTSVGAGLLTTLQPTSISASYIGYQILFGTGIGLGTQLPIVAIQAVLSDADMPLGVAVIIFFQVLGPAVFVLIGQSVFDNRLLAKLETAVPGFHNTTAIDNTGALNVVGLINSTFSGAVVHGYNDALNQTWYIVVALAVLSLIGALGMDWKKLEKSKEEAGSV